MLVFSDVVKEYVFQSHRLTALTLSHPLYSSWASPPFAAFLSRCQTKPRWKKKKTRHTKNDEQNRCGRAGRPGIVVNLATPDVKFVMGKFSKSLGLPFDDCEIQGGRFWSVSQTGVSAKETVGGMGVRSDGESPAEASSAPAEGAVAGGGAAAEGRGVAQIAAEGRGSLPPPPPPPPLRKRPINKGFLGNEEKEVVVGRGAAEDDGDELSLLVGADVDEDIMAEAKAFLEGGGAAGAVPVGGESGASSPSPLLAEREDSVEDVGDVFVGAEDEERTLAEAQAFLKGGQKGGDGGGIDSRLKEVQRKKAGGDVGVVASSGGVEAFAVPGGLAIVNSPGEEEGDGGGLQAEGEEIREYDEDDWGDGDWGDDDDGEEYDEDDGDDEDLDDKKP